jgi:hypothetical protein
MLTDPELRNRIIPAARQTVVKGFDNRRLTQDLVEVYCTNGIGRMTEDRRQRTDNRRQRIEDGGQKTEDRRRMREDGGQKTDDGGI